MQLSLEEIAKRIALVFVIVGTTVVSYLILTAVMPVIVEISNTSIVSANSVGNYTLFREAGKAAPLWLYLVPASISFVVIVLVLRGKR